MSRKVENNYMCRDMEIISRELAEQERAAGAYVQDYESFKKIYRFVVRGLERTKDSAYILLITLEDPAEADPFTPENQEEIMELLFQVIRGDLRRGDVFTQYSSCQFLLMVLSTSGENAVRIGQRIQNCFYKIVSYEYELSLSIDTHPMLQPE